mmetsp:Transcript_20757/g.30121  ORF Transcript_20757/g.30121 Transcript_20757/m.30121 type:complete len:116 (-) Transcript_20757:2087-2434(-)
MNAADLLASAYHCFREFTRRKSTETEKVAHVPLSAVYLEVNTGRSGGGDEREREIRSTIWPNTRGVAIFRIGFQGATEELTKFLPTAPRSRTNKKAAMLLEHEDSSRIPLRHGRM